jgi:tetratricopeptide (TPR) repeat protein
MLSQDKFRMIFDGQRIKVVYIILLAIVVFFPVVLNEFIWDDDAIYDNPLVKSANGLTQIWFNPKANIRELHYWPVVYTTFWIEHHLWADNPIGYHLVNILLHALNIILLWKLLQKIQLPGAWFCALLFAVHPVHVESIAWAIERKDVLSGLFYLAAFLMYLKYQDKPTWKLYLLSLGLFVCALLSKSITVSLPIAILLYVWWKNGRIRLNDLIPFLPFFVVATFIAYFDVAFVNQRSSLTIISLTPWQRVYIAGKSLWFYLEKLVYPLNLITIYPQWKLTVNLFTRFFYPITFLGFLGLLYTGRRYYGRGAFAALTFFAITLAPTLGFIDFSYMYHSYAADRFQYLASIGPLTLFGAWGYRLYTTTSINWKPILRMFGILIIALLGFLSWKQAERYDNDEILFRYTLARNPNAWLAYNNLGLALAEKNQNEAAMQCYLKAIELKPDFVYPYNNLGILLLKEGKPDQAIDCFHQAIQRYPAFAEAQNNMGSALAQQGKLADAILYFQKALALNPYNSKAKYNLERATRELGSESTVHSLKSK